MAGEEQDTEAKIKRAAEQVFLEYGYEGAKIRQIADAAGVNIALVNYYFRSKEQLFKSIYMENFMAFFGRIVMLLNEETPLEVKIWKIVDRYTDFILDNPLIPMFVLSESRNGGTFFKELHVREVIKSAYFTKQLQEEISKGAIRPIKPLHLIMTIIGNIVFPILARPIVSYIGDLDDDGFRQFMEERKKIVPEMVMAYLRPT
ncbi:TetR/AcrR family transcriptional regulator [Nibrella saemangeumensis]|uniref:TetR/AcrR family transcriptional regulator n=2 Tax=Nibrella saemangeumensis TaxID=1084526 RepID=A0ABP8MYE2_9BACT